VSEKLKTWKEREKEHLAEVLKITCWDLERASRLLQIAVSQVKRKIKEHELTRPKNP
jgi:DNA-binding NtrC family response regulator